MSDGRKSLVRGHGPVVSQHTSGINRHARSGGIKQLER